MNGAYLIAGLGNPGRDYRYNRHNIGFRVVDLLAVKLDLHFTRFQSKALIAKGTWHEQKMILVKPQTYMNQSGYALKGLANFYKISPGNLIVIHDDMDLPLGVIRIRPGGGSGGQKGVASIMQYLNISDFPRMRLGIGRPQGMMEPAAYVLQDFKDNESDIAEDTIKRAVDAILLFVDEGLDIAMTRYNKQGNPS